MPLVNIHLIEGKSQDYLQALSDGIHEAMMETWKVPENDRFQIFHEKKAEHFLINKEMWNVERSDNVIIFHITTSPRTKEMKLAFYKRLPEILHKNINLRPEDVFISIISNMREDWSFGNGEAQLLE